MYGSDGFKRRDVLRGTMAVGGLVGLSACATAPRATLQAARPSLDRPPLVPMRLLANEITDVKSCIRPFRVAGPNLDAEQIGDTLVIHNYGHGGSGWSLSWGSAEVAVGKAMSVLPKEIAVIGCGIVGLTAAVHAQRAGLKVTVYARELFARTRSNRAGGLWTPDSRISLTDPAGPGFGDVWEQMARVSWKAFRTYVGLPGAPVEFSNQYGLSDTPIVPRSEAVEPALGTYATTGMPVQSAEFGHYSDRIKDIIPQGHALAPEDNPFAVPYGRVVSQMYFNFGSYSHLLISEFLQGGGTFEMRDFHTPADFTRLREKLVINATGFAAKALCDDKLMIPVRGNTGWLPPQPEAHYGVRYRSALAISKSDGVLVMNFPYQKLGDMYGVGDSSEIPDRADIEAGIATIAPLFAPKIGAAA